MVVTELVVIGSVCLSVKVKGDTTREYKPDFLRDKRGPSDGEGRLIRENMRDPFA